MTKRFLLLAVLALPGAGLASEGSAPSAAAISLPSPAQAPIALLADLSAGQVLLARHADQRFLPASMVKAMTALVAFDLIAAGRLNEDTFVTVSPAAAARWSGKGTTLNLQPREQVSVHDLLMGTTTVSANDAAAVLGEAALGTTAAWLTAMNARAATLGMTGSHFATPNGFPDAGQTYVTANDLIKLAAALIGEHPALYRRYFGHHTMVWRGRALSSRDPFAQVMPGADGIKTGHTSEAGFNFLGAVERSGRRLVLVIGRAPTEPGRAAAAAALAEWGYGAWKSRSFLAAGTVVGVAHVQNGVSRSVSLAVPRSFSHVVPNGSVAAVTGRIIYLGPLRAPIAKGQQVARLELVSAKQPLRTLPLVAAQSIDAAGPIDRIVNGLLGLVT